MTESVSTTTSGSVRIRLEWAKDERRTDDRRLDLDVDAGVVLGLGREEVEDFLGHGGALAETLGRRLRRCRL